VCRFSFQAFLSGIFDLFSQIPQKDGAQAGEQENYLLKSLPGNFQDGGLRVSLLRDYVKQPFPWDLKSRQIFNYFNTKFVVFGTDSC